MFKRDFLSQKRIEFLFSVLVLFFIAWALWEARHWPTHSKLFPWSVGFTVLALALIQVLVALRTALKESSPPGQNRSDALNAVSRTGINQSAFENSVPAADPRRRLLTICSWIVGFFLGIWLLGFKLGSLCLTFLFLKFTAREKWIISIAIAVGTYLFFWLVFDIALKVPLDHGLILDLVETSF
jgi:hypothetical protein